MPAQDRGGKGGTKGPGRALLVAGLELTGEKQEKVEMRRDKVESGQQLLSSGLSLLFTSSFYKNFYKTTAACQAWAEIWGDMAVILKRHLLWR